MLASLTIERDLDLTMIKRDLDNSVATIVGLVGGFALLVWLMFYVVDMCFTMTKFRNYMASELYSASEGEPSGLTSTRSLTSMGYHNAIFPAKEKTLNLSRVTICHRMLCCQIGKGPRIFAKARDYTAQELNITSIIKSQRESQAAIELLRASMGAKAD